MGSEKSVKEKDSKEGKERERERGRDKERERESSRKGKGKETSASSAAAAYGPEFLRAFAKPASLLSGKGRRTDDDEASFDVISGADARRFARRFVREQEAAVAETDKDMGKGKDKADADKDTDKQRPDEKTEREHDLYSNPKANARTLPPVVFAFPRSAAGDAGRKVVDFYMSWRGKTKATRLKGLTRRAGFLDAEFRRVRETLDGEWKRASRALKGSASASALHDEGAKLMRAPTDPQTPPRLPPLLAEYAREEREREGHAPGPQTMRSVSDPLPPPSSFPFNTDRPALGSHRGSIDSVTSLPLLGMVRGVPAGNRVPLRVTNPGDRMSMSSTSGSVVMEAPKRGSPLRGGVAFYMPESDDVEDAQTHTLQLPGRTASDSSGVSEGASSSGSSRKSKSRKEKKTRIDDGEQEKILIVLLDEKDKGKAEEKGKSMPGDDASWHGLERRLSTRSTRKPSPPGSVHDSPWVGPLVHLDEDITYIHTPEYSDSDDDDDDKGSDWGLGQGPRGAAVPIKSLLSAMGYLTPEAAVMGGTPSPYGSYAALPTPFNSPYAAAAHLAAYSSPYVASQQGSPYHSPYQQPPSRPHTPVSYYAGGTPPAPAPLPAWASPGGGYPPTNYASPAPGGYASPYASPAVPYASPIAPYASPIAPYASPAAGYASPAAGYAGSAAGHASPAAGYTNLAAGYSSPYVPPVQGPHGPSFYYS
ncbi:hypothetical protein FB451DRAFT_1562098 [Mycena latifolia]|nr:hypothetical protein FB451DRAFT_1562098 [Mycena latifolia]